MNEKEIILKKGQIWVKNRGDGIKIFEVNNKSIIYEYFKDISEIKSLKSDGEFHNQDPIISWINLTKATLLNNSKEMCFKQKIR